MCAEHTEASRAYASFQHLEVHAVGDLLAWLKEPPTKLVAVGDPVELDGLAGAAAGALRAAAVHLQVAAVLPRVREP